MKLGLYHTPYTKITLFYTIHSKLIKDLIVRPETIKIQEENIGGKGLDISFGSDCLDMKPKAQTTSGTVSNLKASAQQRKPSTT